MRESSDIQSVFYFFASQTLNNKEKFKKTSGKVKDKKGNFPLFFCVYFISSINQPKKKGKISDVFYFAGFVF
jgi:hypothetical protein